MKTKYILVIILCLEVTHVPDTGSKGKLRAGAGLPRPSVPGRSGLPGPQSSTAPAGPRVVGGGGGGLAAAMTSQRFSSPLAPWLPSVFVFHGQKETGGICGGQAQLHCSGWGAGHAAKLWGARCTARCPVLLRASFWPNPHQSAEAASVGLLTPTPIWGPSLETA